jgi:phage tail-like protein
MGFKDLAKNAAYHEAAGLLGLSPGISHHFVVNVMNGPYDFGTWSKVSGLSVNWDVCEYRTGSTGNGCWVFPGNTKYERVKLSRAACFDSQTVQEWLAETSRSVTPLSGAIVMCDSRNLPILSWELKQFFPCGWAITDFEAGSASHVAIETLTIAHTGFLGDEVMR